MTEKDIISICIQFPVVAMFFWIVRGEITKLAERVDNQSRLFQELVKDTNVAIREASAVNAALKTAIENLVIKCAAEEKRAARVERNDHA